MNFIKTMAVFISAGIAVVNGGGVWRRPLSEMSEATDHHPQGKRIYQENFKIGTANCSGSKIAVEFNIPRSERMTIKMYTPAGREMASLVNKHLDAGSYRYFWDTHTLAQGCYAIKLLAGANTCSKLVQIVH